MGPLDTSCNTTTSFFLFKGRGVTNLPLLKDLYIFSWNPKEVSFFSFTCSYISILMLMHPWVTPNIEFESYSQHIFLFFPFFSSISNAPTWSNMKKPSFIHIWNGNKKTRNIVNIISYDNVCYKFLVEENKIYKRNFHRRMSYQYWKDRNSFNCFSELHL